MNKYEQEAKDLVDEFKKYVESDPFYSNKGGTIQESIVYNAKDCALIAVNFALEENAIFHYKLSPLIVARRRHLKALKQAIKAIET